MPKGGGTATTTPPVDTQVNSTPSSPKDHDSGSSQPPATAGALVIQGTVKTIVSAPAPGSQPYKDCIIPLQIQVTKVVSGSLKPQEILVYTWGLRDNRLVNTELGIGKTVTVQLTSWDIAEKTYGRYNRIDPVNDDAFMLDAYWGEICH